jgi:hypothetical protein
MMPSTPNGRREPAASIRLVKDRAGLGRSSHPGGHSGAVRSRASRGPGGNGVDPADPAASATWGARDNDSASASWAATMIGLGTAAYRLRQLLELATAMRMALLRAL